MGHLFSKPRSGQPSESGPQSTTGPALRRGKLRSKSLSTSSREKRPSSHTHTEVARYVCMCVLATHTCWLYTMTTSDNLILKQLSGITMQIELGWSLTWTCPVTMPASVCDHYCSTKAAEMGNLRSTSILAIFGRAAIICTSTQT